MIYKTEEKRECVERKERGSMGVGEWGSGGVGMHTRVRNGRWSWVFGLLSASAPHDHLALALTFPGVEGVTEVEGVGGGKGGQGKGVKYGSVKD